jgi:hypothetical protein
LPPEFAGAGLEEDVPEVLLEELPPLPQATDTARIENPNAAMDRSLQGLSNIYFTFLGRFTTHRDQLLARASYRRAGRMTTALEHVIAAVTIQRQES